VLKSLAYMRFRFRFRFSFRFRFNTSVEQFGPHAV